MSDIHNLFKMSNKNKILIKQTSVVMKNSVKFSMLHPSDLDSFKTDEIKRKKFNLLNF